jgi:hypothetical protein
MSLEVTCKTQIKDRDALVEVLNDILGKGAAKVVENQKISGYSSNKQIEVAISKISGMYGTAGYYKNKDGSYSLVYDSMDRSRLSKILPRKVGGNTVDPVSQGYAKRKVMASIRSLRGRLTNDTVEADGTIRLKVKVTQY